MHPVHIYRRNGEQRILIMKLWKDSAICILMLWFSMTAGRCGANQEFKQVVFKSCYEALSLDLHARTTYTVNFFRSTLPGSTSLDAVSKCSTSIHQPWLTDLLSSTCDLANLVSQSAFFMSNYASVRDRAAMEYTQQAGCSTELMRGVRCTRKTHSSWLLWSNLGQVLRGAGASKLAPAASVCL